MLKTLLAISLTVIACGKSKEGAPAGDQPAAATKPAEAKLAAKQLGSLPLQADIPDDANVEDTTKGAGYPSATIYASPTFFVNGGGDMSDLKPTIDDSKTALAKTVNDFKAWTRADKTADGWILEGNGQSMVDNKPLLAVWVRRTIGGAPYDCGTNADTKEQIAKVLAECQSLRAK
ncbi:MAG TPA: hypothetical protein VGF94_30105 [Kofleriaceae bacterium]|jgi:hypothetical protein